MKKHISSSLKPKAPVARRSTSRRRAKTPEASRRIVRRSAPSVVAASPITSEIVEPVMPVSAPITAPVIPPQESAPTILPPDDLVVTDEDLSAPPSRISLSSISAQPDINTNERERRRMMMWVGVSISMFFVMCIWAWSAQRSLNAPIQQTPASEIKDDFERLYQDVTTSLDTMQPLLPTEPSNSTDTDATPPLNEGAAANPSSPPMLTPDIIEALKKQLEKQAETPQNTPAP